MQHYARNARTANHTLCLIWGEFVCVYVVVVLSHFTAHYGIPSGSAVNVHILVICQFKQALSCIYWHLFPPVGKSIDQFRLCSGDNDDRKSNRVIWFPFKWHPITWSAPSPAPFQVYLGSSCILLVSTQHSLCFTCKSGLSNAVCCETCDVPLTRPLVSTKKISLFDYTNRRQCQHFCPQTFVIIIKRLFKYPEKPQHPGYQPKEPSK